MYNHHDLAQHAAHRKQTWEAEAHQWRLAREAAGPRRVVQFSAWLSRALSVLRRPARARAVLIARFTR